MRARVTIHDHVAERTHVSTWCVPGSGVTAIEGAIHAAFVRAYGTSAGEITFREEVAFAKMMKVDVEQITDSDQPVPAINGRQVRIEERRAEADARERAAA